MEHVSMNLLITYANVLMAGRGTIALMILMSVILVILARTMVDALT
jgi:hypothetical protein